MSDAKKIAGEYVSTREELEALPDYTVLLIWNNGDPKVACQKEGDALWGAGSETGIPLGNIRSEMQFLVLWVPEYKKE